jgi:hypothetical protein
LFSVDLDRGEDLCDRFCFEPILTLLPLTKFSIEPLLEIIIFSKIFRAFNLLTSSPKTSDKACHNSDALSRT